MAAEGSGTTQAEVGIEGDQAAVESAVVEGIEGDAVPGVEAGGLTVFQQDLVPLFRVLIMPSLS